MHKMIVVGRIGSPHGIQGWMKLFSYTHPLDNILHYTNWFIEAPDGWQPLDRENIQTQITSDGHIRIKFMHCETPESARLYTNLLISIPREQLPTLSLGDYYWSDLEGLQVVNTAGAIFGRVDHLFETGANDVLVIKGDRERLVPYIKDVVLKVDLEGGRILVDWDADF